MISKSKIQSLISSLFLHFLKKKTENPSKTPWTSKRQGKNSQTYTKFPSFYHIFSATKHPNSNLPGLPPHLETLAGESNGNLPLHACAFHVNLEIVHETLHRRRPIPLDNSHVVPVHMDGGVLHRQLVRRHQQEPAGAVDGVELRGRLLPVVVVVDIHGGARRAKTRELEEVGGEILAVVVQHFCGNQRFMRRKADLRDLKP